MAKGRKAKKHPTVNKTAEGFNRIPLELTEGKGDARTVVLSTDVLQVVENAEGLNAAISAYAAHGGEGYDGAGDVARMFNSAIVSRARSVAGQSLAKLNAGKLTQEDFDKILRALPNTLFVPGRAKSAEERVLDKRSKELRAAAQEKGMSASEIDTLFADMLAKLGK